MNAKQKSQAIMPFIGKPVTHKATMPVGFKDGAWTYEVDHRRVILLSVSGSWAMVRRPRCCPYVAPVNEIILPS